jgi:carbonic anhydrase
MMRFGFNVILKRSILQIILFSLAGILLVSCRDDAFPKDPHEWEYASEHPKNAWEKDYPLCRRGGFQSPIDINTTNVKNISLYPLKIQLLNHGNSLVNNGYSAQVVFKQKKNTLLIKNEKYILQEFHFHTPSENMIDGRRYPMELHWVYCLNGKKWIVVGVLFQAGVENETLTQLLKYLPQKKGKVDIRSMAFDFNQLLSNNRSSYYTFEGSLTTPPCSRHITWYLLKEPITASTSQIDQLYENFGNNSRPIQPINQRIIEFNQL